MAAADGTSGPAHDDGLFSALYNEFPDEAEARLKERDLYESVCGPLPAPGTEAAEPEAAPELFKDATFEGNTALYRNPFQPPRGALPADLLEWRSVAAGEVDGLHSPALMGEADTPDPGVVQGALRDCWLVGALAALASKPELIDELFVSTELSSRGLFTLRFFKNGMPRYVHVDDRLPCNRAGHVHFARSKAINETWLALVEKAYAKLHGCFENLTHGSVDQGLRDLTGWPVFKLDMATLDADQLWARLQLLFAQPGHLLTCQWEKTTGIPAHGVLAYHAYLILEVQQVQAEATADFDAVNLRMVKLRNPWGQGSWSGDWNADSVKWTNYPEIKRKLTPVTDEDEEPPSAAANEGAEEEEAKEEVAVCQPDELWMEYSDFLRHFSHLAGAFDVRDPDPAAEGHKNRYRGEWVPGDLRTGSGGGPLHRTWPTNPQYAFELDQPANVAVNLAVAPDQRWQNVGYQGTPTYQHEIGYVVMALTGTKTRLTKFHPKKVRGSSWTTQVAPSVSGMCLLQPGNYVVVPFTAQPQAAPVKFVLEIFANKPVMLVSPDDQMPEVDDLQESDDEELGPFTESGVDAAEPATLDPENDGQELQALAFQARDLAVWVKGLITDVSGLEARVATLEGGGAAAK